MKPRFHAFWAINAPLNQPRLRRQLEQFRAAGFDGVVWHPRFYPNEPPYLGDRYLAELSATILHAKSLGLAFWLYDEDGWPSGTVGGQLLKQFPNDAQRWAELVPVNPDPKAVVNAPQSKRFASIDDIEPARERLDGGGFSAAPGSRTITTFEHSGQWWSLVERIGAGVDYFNPDLARHFLQLTHERYRTGLKPEAWEHVEAIFCDEPEFGLGHAYDSLSKHGAIPWTPEFPELFRARHGEDLLPHIQHLFYADEVCPLKRVEARAPERGVHAAGASDDTATIRVKFWELLTDRFNESFTVPINDWCTRNGKLFTAHVKGEEHPLFQVPTHGSSHQFFRNLSLPAIDALERYPANNFFPRQVSAAARQFGDGRCMVEAFGGAGWGARPEDLERYLLWLGRNGLTDFVMHLSQYRFDSAAMRDWPPSQPLHLTWREAYPEVLARVRRELETHPRPAADTLVIAPNRGIMANYAPPEFLQTNVHNAATYPDTVAGRMNRKFLERVEELHRAGVNYDIADERTVDHFCQRAGEELVLGNCNYRRVIVGEGCQLNGAAGILPAVVPGFPPGGTTVRESARAEISSDVENSCPHPAGKLPAATITVAWTLEKHPRNLLPLESAAEADGWFAARFTMAAALGDARLELVFADDLATVELNGHRLAIVPVDDGSTAAVDSNLIQPANTLRFRAANPKVQRPFVWLRGLFRVMSRALFVAGPNHTLKTAGPLTLHPARDTIHCDLVADGFPFLREPVCLAGEVTLLDAIASLHLDGGEADAVRLKVGESDFGWAWRVDGKISFALNLPAGKHRLRLELVPNGFNAFGPHHYYGGDWHIVSPDQIKGVRNFADSADAPAQTHVAAWHFRRFELPVSISIY